MSVQTQPAPRREQTNGALPPIPAPRPEVIDTRAPAPRPTPGLAAAAGDPTTPHQFVIDEITDWSEADAMVAAQEPTDGGSGAARRPGLHWRRLALPVGAVVLLGAAWFGFTTFRNAQMYVSTDNAQLTGTPVQVGSMNAGRVAAVMPVVGSTVHKGDPIARIELPSQVGTAQNGQPKLDFLPSGDSTVAVEAPMDGVVLAVPTTPGATVQAGQPLVTLVDPTVMWVNANVEETNVSRLQPGQPVTVHVDALNADVPGRVDSITPATASSFSLLPSSNASGNFTKVTQLVPVRIDVNLGNQPVLLGSSAEVKIKVA
jgi:multidrug efflux pump subunit AcrA (membrane-fusion protein)